MISVSRLKEQLGITGQDQYLARLEAGAVADVQTITGRYLGTPKAFEDIRDVRPLRHRLTPPENIDQRPVLKLSQPAAGLDALTIEERYSTDGAWQTVEKTTAADLAVFELEGQRLYRLVGYWPQGARRARISYNFGYAVDGGPAEFEAVLFDLIEARYSSPTVRTLGRVMSAGVKGATVTMTGGGPGAIPDAIYKRILALRTGGSI